MLPNDAWNFGRAVEDGLGGEGVRGVFFGGLPDDGVAATMARAAFQLQTATGK